MKQKYDLMLLISGTFSEEQVGQVQEKVVEAIKKLDGQIEKTDEAMRRRLAYVIKKVRNGAYVDMRIELDKEKINTLKKEISLIPDVLRSSLTVARDFKKPSERTYQQSSEESKELEVAPKQEIEESSDVKSESRLDVGKDKKESTKKVDMEELDKKIDELLDTDIN